jgi:hypothetical protein
MTVVPVSPIVLKDVTLVIDTDNFEMHCSQVQFDPTTQLQTWKGLTPSAVFTDQSAPTWACTLAYAQDWSTVDTLSSYLYAHQGELKHVKFKPDVNSAQAEWDADIIISAGPVGGTVDTFSVGTVTLGVQGIPTPTYPPPVAARAAKADRVSSPAKGDKA